MPCPTLPMFNGDAQLSAAGGSCRHVLHHAELPAHQKRVNKSREEPLGPWSAPEQWPGGDGSWRWVSGVRRSCWGAPVLCTQQLVNNADIN